MEQRGRGVDDVGEPGGEGGADGLRVGAPREPLLDQRSEPRALGGGQEQRGRGTADRGEEDDGA